MKELCLFLLNSKKDDEVAVPVCAQEHEMTSVQVMRMKLRKMIQNARTENGATGCLRTLACFSRLPAMSRHVLWHVYSGP